MKRIAVAAGVASLVGIMLLAGCSHSGSGSRTDGALGLKADGANGGAAAPAAPNGRSAPGPAKTDPGAKAALTSSALIRTAELSVEIGHGGDVGARADQAGRIATAAGGQVYADERSGGATPTATLTLKVPGGSLVSVLGQLQALGKEKSRHASTQDVTTEVADVSSRVRSAQASIDRLRLLFGRASKIGDVIALESELSQREADLESLQAQQRSLAAQTAMATVTLNLSTAGAAAHRRHTASGFLGGLDRGWRAFQSAAGGLATGVGAVLPFLLLALPVGAAVALRRRLHTNRPPAATPPEPA
jgi:hypothetical protein